MCFSFIFCQAELKKAIANRSKISNSIFGEILNGYLEVGGTMERVVECWLDSHKEWFKKYAIENLDLNTVEKWLRSNRKQICKCRRNKDSISNVTGTHLVCKSANNLSVSQPQTQAQPLQRSSLIGSTYKMISMTNLQARVDDEAESDERDRLRRYQNENSGRKFSLNSKLDDILVSGEQVFDVSSSATSKPKMSQKQHSVQHQHQQQTQRKLNCNNCIIHKRKLHNNNFEPRGGSDEKVTPDSLIFNNNKSNTESQNMNDTVIPILVNHEKQQHQPQPTEENAMNGNDSTDITTPKNETLNLLPPNSSLNLLKCLIKSKLKFQSNVKQASKFKLAKEVNLNETKHLLDLIKDISRELRLKQLVERIVCNVRLLVGSEYANVHFVCQNKQRLASFRTKKANSSSTFSLAPGKSLSGATMFDDTLNDFDNEIPFGNSLLGKVATTGNLINVFDVKKVCASHSFLRNYSRMLIDC